MFNTDQSRVLEGAHHDGIGDPDFDFDMISGVWSADSLDSPDNGQLTPVDPFLRKSDTRRGLKLESTMCKT